MDIITKIKNTYKNIPDLVIKSIKGQDDSIFVLYLESVSSSDKVNDYILKNLSLVNDKINEDNILSFIPSPNIKKITQVEIPFYLNNGFAIIIYKNVILASETRADLNRSITESTTEPALNGPKDAFTENYQINLGLIKRRIKSTSLKVINENVGKRTNTQVSILYIDDVADKALVKKALERIKKINIDGLIDSSKLSHQIDDNKRNLYPTINETERPDVAATNLLEGKIVILVDTTPFALIIPSFLIDYINPTTDNYNKYLNINFIKILRIIAFLIAIFTPAIYIALINFNQEAIPTNLLINLAHQRANLPFPAIIEATIMLFVYEILREGDLRFPSSYGSALSILGAIIIGEASVSAGLVSPIIIIIVAITFLSSLIFTNQELNNSIRYFRIVSLVFTSTLGIYGLFLATIYFLIYTIDTYSFNKPYLAPIEPFEKYYFFNKVFKKSNFNYKRSPLTAKKDLVSGR